MNTGKKVRSPANLTIKSFFSKGASGKSPVIKPKQTCPLCNQAATLRDINDHLDNGCPPRPDQDSKVNVDTIFEDSDSDYENVSTSSTRHYRASASISKSPNKFGVSTTKRLAACTVTPTQSPKKQRLWAGKSPTVPKWKSSPGKAILTNGESPRKLKSPAKLNTEVKERLFVSQEETSHVPLTQSKRQDPTHVPYYLVNFECILRGVIDETDDVELFNDQELSVVKAFRSLTLDAKRLYVRLFQRKFTWIMASAISYDEIHDLQAATGCLIANNLLVDGSQLDDLEKMLNLLTAPNIRKLAKDMNVQPGKGCTQKQDFVTALMSQAKKKVVFFTKSSRTIEKTILQKAKRYVGHCFKLTDEPRKIFLRILSLYSLSNWWDERENDKGQSAPQLTTVLLQTTGRLTFPIFSIIRKTKLFRHRDDLLLFESACAIEADMSQATSDKDWTGAVEVQAQCLVLFNDTLSNPDISEHVATLPQFLRKFTTGSVLAYVLTKGVDALERKKLYKEAVDLLEHLISQSLYLPHYHGHWYERLTLDLDQHLKRPREAVEAINRGLNDQFVREARQLTLCQRLQKICSAKKNISWTKDEGILEKFAKHKNWNNPPDPTCMTVQGKLMPKENMPGAKTVFVYEGCSDQDESLLCSVEEFVKEHYKRQLGYSNGLHAEGSVVNTLAAILFWDIIYDCDIPDAFRSPHQTSPLDFDSDDFYASRKTVIDKRLEEIEMWSVQELHQVVQSRWASWHDVNASIVNWDLFSCVDQLVGLVSCFEGKQLSGLCERLMKNHRHTRSGFPDLTVWDVHTKKVCFVEVKGPGDRLSNKQILWIDYLSNTLGLSALVCHVEAVNGKRLGNNRRHLSSPPKQIKAVEHGGKTRLDDSDDDFA